MPLSKKQHAAMAAIVAAGVLATAAVLMTGRGQAEAAPAAVPHEPREPHELRLDEAQIRQAGIAIEAAGPASLQASSPFPGELRFDADRTAHVVPRLAGVAVAVPANLGDTVRRGQLLAVIASTGLSDLRSELLAARRRHEAAGLVLAREQTLFDAGISARQDLQQARTALQEADIALQNARQKLAAVGAVAEVGDGDLNRFEVRAPFDGTIVEKHLAPGEAVKEDASIFTLSDLRTVWAEFAVAPRDLAAVRVGQQAVVTSSAFEGSAAGTVSYVGALLGEQTRTARARVTLANPAGAWRPGLFVTVAVLGERQPVPLAVSAQALQSVDGRQVVFKAVTGGFAATPVTTGRSDGRSVEVLQGLAAGDRVASSNTFVLKADLGKTSVEED